MVSSINRFVRNSTLDKFECERDSSRDLSSTRYTNKIIVPNDKEVTYRVEYAGYVTQEQTAIYENDTKLDIKLELPRYKLTVNPTPSDATVVLTASGFTQVGNSIEVTEGTTVTYTVSKNKYTPKSGSVIMSNVEKTVDVSLTKENYTITVNPTPSTATVTLAASGYYQSGNSITVPADTVVHYSVSADKHITQTGTVTADKTKSVSVELVKLITITVNPIPSDATVTLRAPDMPEYTQSGNSITIPSTTYAQFYVEREGYQSTNGGWLSNQFSEDYTATIELTPLNYTLSVTPTPSDATVTLTAAGYTQSGNSITVPYTTDVSYKVAKTHYGTKTGTKSVTKDENINVSLAKNQYTITVNPTPSNATVSLTATGFAQSGNSITVDALSTVNYTVSASKYVSKSGTITADNSKTVDVSLAKETYTLTVNPTPSDATVTLTASGYTQSGNSITVPVDTNVNYSVAKTNYVTQSGTHTVTANKTLNIGLQKIQYTLTIVPVPANSTVTLTASGYAQSGNSITVDNNTTVSYTVSCSGCVTKSGTTTVTGNSTITVTLATEPTLITTTTTKALEAGTYRYVVIGAGGSGATATYEDTSGSYKGNAGPSGGGGGSGYVSVGTFTLPSEQNVTFSVGTTSGGSSTITGASAGVLAQAAGGKNGSNAGAGGAGGSGGGAGGYGSVGTQTVYAGGSGGIAGYNGSTAYSSHSAGAGSRNANGQTASNAGTAATYGGSSAAYGTAGQGGSGCSSLQSTLLTINGLDAATANSVYAAMAGGGGGGGNYVTSRTTTANKTVWGQPGGGGGGWSNGAAGSGTGTQNKGGAGGAGAIIYRRVA